MSLELTDDELDMMDNALSCVVSEATRTQLAEDGPQLQVLLDKIRAEMRAREMEVPLWNVQQ